MSAHNLDKYKDMIPIQKQNKNLNLAINVENKDIRFFDSGIMPLDTPVKPEYDKADIMLLDTRIKSEYDTERARKSEYDNIESSSLSFPCLTRESRSHECRIETGRSMVEMLGVLAIIGVLSIGGIMGYSYAVDKYHANQIMNDVNLRGIDLIAQASRGGDFSLAEWPTKTSSDLDIGLEIDEATNTTEGGIYVNGVEKDICEIIADDLLPEDIKLVIDGEEYLSGTCGATNKMVFYYDAIGEALGEKDDGCDGVLNDGVCMDCPENATVSDNGLSCECQNDLMWNYVDNICEQKNECIRTWSELASNPKNFKQSHEDAIYDGDLVLNLSYEKDMSSTRCTLKVNGTLTINGNGWYIRNMREIMVKSATSHGIILNNITFDTFDKITAETTADNAYAIYSNNGDLTGGHTEVIANGTNGGALYLKDGDISNGLLTIHIKENADNQVVVGENSTITNIGLTTGSNPIPETEGIMMQNVYQEDF